MPDLDHSRLAAANPASTGITDETFQTPELNVAIEFVLSHLRRESAYLDTVIECSLKMKDVLRERSTNPNAPSTAENATGTAALASETTAGSGPASLQSHEKLDALRGDLARQFVPVLEGRQQMKSALKDFKPILETPTVSSLATRLNEPDRRELKQLRDDIKEKLNEVRAITMGNQAVLIYTMDFYHRLLTGLSNDVEPAKAYNKSGKLTNQVGSGMLQKEC